MTEIDKTAIHKEVDQAFRGLVDAILAMDTEQYFGFFDPKLYTALNANGSVTHSFKLFSDLFREQINFVEAYKELSFHNVKITVLDEKNAVLVNEFEAKVHLKEGNQIISTAGAGTQVWAKHSGEWKLVHVASAEKVPM
jgi:ketosteroid isomerase-like protein